MRATQNVLGKHLKENPFSILMIVLTLIFNQFELLAVYIILGIGFFLLPAVK